MVIIQFLIPSIAYTELFPLHLILSFIPINDN